MKQVFDTNKDRLEEVHWIGLCRLNSRSYILSVESTQCIHSHLSTAEEDVEFAVEMTAKCTKLKVLELSFILAFSSQSFLNILNKSTSLQTLLLKEVQLSDMVSPP